MGLVHESLTGDQVSTVEIGVDVGRVAVLHKANVTDPVYFTVGSATTEPADPVVGATGYYLGAGARRVVSVTTDGPTIVKLVSDGAVDVEVET